MPFWLQVSSPLPYTENFPEPPGLGLQKYQIIITRAEKAYGVRKKLSILARCSDKLLTRTKRREAGS
jgi:hypothetical protein